jgi:hypothetical protein
MSSVPRKEMAQHLHDPPRDDNRVEDLLSILEAGTVMFKFPSRKRGKVEKKRFCLRADTCEIHQYPPSHIKNQPPEEMCKHAIFPGSIHSL